MAGAIAGARENGVGRQERIRSDQDGLSAEASRRSSRVAAQSRMKTLPDEEHPGDAPADEHDGDGGRHGHDDDAERTTEQTDDDPRTAACPSRTWSGRSADERQRVQGDEARSDPAYGG
jgi:hypothetical protein